MSEDFEALTVADYAKQAARTDQRSGGRALGFSMLGLFGEVGSLLSEAKKKQRDDASYLGYAHAVAEELGDVLWYLAAIARRSRRGDKRRTMADGRQRNAQFPCAAAAAHSACQGTDAAVRA